MDRRTFLKRAFAFLFALIGVSGGTYFYSREIEPSKLGIRKENLVSEKIPLPFHDKRIVQFSDTHLGFDYSVDDLTNLVKKINSLQPDIIVFTGDLIDNPKLLHEKEMLAIIEALKGLYAPLGKYWIYGNHDHGGYGTEIIKELMDSAEFSLLQNSHVKLTLQNESIILSGIDDLMLGKPDIKTALNDVDQELFTILLAHEPDFADVAVKFPIDVQLSGHSHGGQVRVPIIGHLYTPLYAEKYVLGKYVIENRLELFVNAGIGTTRLPYRLFCQPEIHVFTLKGKMS